MAHGQRGYLAFGGQWAGLPQHGHPSRAMPERPVQESLG
jgi:hypothetical protein